MINEVIVEGIVVRDPWKFMEDLFFRLVVYRDSDQPSKKLDLERDAGDYINVRVNGGANGLIHIRRGMRLRVHGFLQSRDYRESLEEFIGKARKSKPFGELAIEIKTMISNPARYRLTAMLLRLLLNASSFWNAQTQPQQAIRAVRRAKVMMKHKARKNQNLQREKSRPETSTREIVRRKKSPPMETVI